MSWDFPFELVMRGIFFCTFDFEFRVLVTSVGNTVKTKASDTRFRYLFMV